MIYSDWSAAADIDDIFSVPGHPIYRITGRKDEGEGISFICRTSSGTIQQFVISKV